MPSLDLVYDRTYIVRQDVLAGTEAGLRKLAFDIQSQAQRNITALDAVDTGAMRASVFTSVGGQSNYAAAAAAATTAARRPGRHSGRAHSFEMAPDEPTRSLEAVVAVGASYGINVELGTAFTPARPFLGPAAERVMGRAPVEIARTINQSLPD